MRLQFEKQEFIVVDSSDLNDFINKQYKFKEKYDCISEQEWSNDSSYPFEVNSKFQDYDEADLQELLKTGDCSYRTGLLLNDQCRKGNIPAGNYLIQVCW